MGFPDRGSCSEVKWSEQWTYNGRGTRDAPYLWATSLTPHALCPRVSRARQLQVPHEKHKACPSPCPRHKACPSPRPRHKACPSPCPRHKAYPTPCPRHKAYPSSCTRHKACPSCCTRRKACPSPRTRGDGCRVEHGDTPAVRHSSHDLLNGRSE